VLLKPEALIGLEGLVLTFPATIARRTKGLTLIIPGEFRGPDPSVLALISQGRCWFEELATGRADSIKSIAQAHGVTHRYVGRLIVLGLLSPKLIELLLSGGDLGATAAQLKVGPLLPVSWKAQHRLLQASSAGSLVPG
jgi:hypothetical protein